MESVDYPLLSEYEELMKPESILNMDEDTYKNVLNPRFWYAGEDCLWLWKCNALRSMINSGDSMYHNIIKQNCDNADERIREIANIAYQQDK
jgi:epoxyqueuosine reductase